MTCLNHKILAGNFVPVRLFSGLEVSRGPVLYDSLSFAKMPTFKSLKGKIDVAGIDIEFSYNIPDVQVCLNPYTEKIESQMWDHCQKFGLYEGKEKPVKVSKFSWLPGLVDSELSEDALRAVSNGFLDLFVHDDDIDNQEGKPNFSGLQPANQRFIDIASGRSLLETDLGKVKGYAEAIETFFSTHLTDGNREDFVRTLTNYLRSTEVEASHMKKSVKKSTEKVPSYADYIENRRDTSGIYHAVVMMWVAHDLNVKDLLERYYPLKTIFKFVPDVVCRINDVASCKKELNGFGQLADRSEILTVEDAESIRPFITSNSVLLKFRSGLSFSQSVADTLDEYHDVLNGIVDNLDLLQSDLASDHSLKKAVDVLLGWVVGHGIWAGVSKRYNMDIS